jgi:hypothetical protein
MMNTVTPKTRDEIAKMGELRALSAGEWRRLQDLLFADITK